MSRSRVAFLAALSVVAVITVAVIVALTVDLGRFKGYAENLVSDALGRKFEIRGTFKLELGRKIFLSAEDIHLSGPDWADDKDLASVGRLETSIDALSLITGPVTIDSLNIAGAEVFLDERDDGKNNWTMAADPGADADSETPDMVELPLMVLALEILDSRLTYSDPSMQQPLIISVEQVSEVVSESGTVQVKTAGKVNRTPFSLSAHIADVNSLINLNNVSATLQGRLGEIGLDVKAELDHLLSPRRPTVQVQLRGPNAEYLTDIIGLERITTGPLSLDAAVSPGEQHMNISVQGKFGEFSTDANGYIVDLGNFDEMYIHATASGPNAATIGKLLGNDSVPEDPFRLEVDAKTSGASIQLNPLHLEIGVTKLDASASIDNFPSPDGASANVQISGPDFGKFNKLFGLPGKLTGPFQLNASVSALPDKKAAVSLQASADDLSLTIKGTVLDTPAFEGTTIDLIAKGPNFATIARTMGVSESPSDAFELLLSIEKEGGVSKISEGRFRVGNDKLHVAGQVGDKPLRSGTNLQFEITGPNFRKTLMAYGATAERLPADEWSARGNLEWDDGQLVLEQVHTVIGTNREYLLDIESRVTNNPSYIGSTAQISFAGAEFGAVAEVGGVLDLPNATFHVTGDIERVASGYSISNGNIQLGNDKIRVNGLIGEKPLRQDSKVTVDVAVIDLRETLESFGLPVENVPTGPLDASGQLLSQGDIFVLQNVSANTSGATMKATGHLGAFPRLVGTDIDLHISGKDLSQLLPANASFKTTTDTFALKSKIQVSAEALTIKGLDASLGEARLQGMATASRDPALKQGTFAIQADAPDFGKLLRQYSDYSTKDGVAMKLAATGNWDEKFLHFEDFLFTLAGGRLAIKGSLDGPPNFERTDLIIDLHVANVNNLSPLAGRELPNESGTLHAHLSGTKDQMTLDEFDAKLGKSDIDGEFSLQGGDVPIADIKMVSKLLDLSGYLAPQQEPAKKTETATKDKLLPTTPLNLDAMRKLNAKVDLRIDELVLRQRSVRNIVLIGTLDDGLARVTEFNLTGPRGGSMSGAFVLRDVGPGADITVNLTGTQLSLGLPATSQDELESLPQYDVDAALTGTGTNVAQLAGSLNGFIRLVSGPGKVRAGAMRMFTQDFLAQLFNTVNPFAKTDPYSNVKCAAVLLKADNGTIVGQPALVVQTDKLNIFANADINLKSEKISVALNTVPQTGLGLSLSNLVTPYTKVSGTLANPTLALDAEGAIVQGGAAVATAGISFLAMRFKDRYLSAKDACGKAVDDVHEEFERLQTQYSVAGR